MSQSVQPPRLGSTQPIIGTVGLGQMIATAGTYPQPGPGPATNVIAMIHTIGVGFPAFGASACNGSPVKIWSNQALMSLLGTAFGGDGRTEFGLPDLRNRVAIGGTPGQEAGQTLAMTWMIAVQAGSDSFPMLGAMGLFAGNHPPAGWLPADGSMLVLRDYVPLFELIGTTFGGDGESIFALPDLQGRAVAGVGQGPTVSIVLGQAIEAGPDTDVACLGLNYIVNVSGALPPDNGDGGFPNSASVLGEFIAYAGPSIPDGWVTAAGQELPIADNEALFQLIGTTFGGDGEVSFALPDLRGHMVAGLGS